MKYDVKTHLLDTSRQAKNLEDNRQLCQKNREENKIGSNMKLSIKKYQIGK